MSVKSWVLDHLHELVGRPDLVPREPVLSSGDPPRSDASPPSLADAAHLGAYAALVTALREELEHFVASQVRLHLAIADRDRFLLTAVSVRCREAGPARQRLVDFVREFKPEQIKRFLARDVIGALPNAAAIDLSQFAGLVDADSAPAEGAEKADDGGEYRELLEALRRTPSPLALRPYEVSIVGRWVEQDAVRASTAAPSRPLAAPPTPMAGLRVEFEIEDADGRRPVALQGVVPGRRYAIGKGEGCELRVNATYASRRHAELWFDAGRWWVADAGSTNGLRVEPPPGAGAAAAPVGSEAALALAEGARLVLSARAQGPAADHAWIALRGPGRDRAAAAPAAQPTPLTPIAALPQAAAAAAPIEPDLVLDAPPAAWPAGTPSTPLTAIMVARPSQMYSLAAESAGLVRSVGLHPGLLPFSVGRSRNQGLVVDRRHEGVSGQHLEIVELDGEGATIVVHGDNGVWIDGRHHGPGTRLRWAIGQPMLLGEASRDAPGCRLSLAAMPQS